MALTEQERLIKTLNERLANIGRVFGKESTYYKNIVDYYTVRQFAIHQSKSGFMALDYNQKAMKESNEAYMNILRKAAGYSINKQGQKVKVQGLNTVASIKAQARESLKASGITEARLRKQIREAHPRMKLANVRARAHKEFEKLVKSEVEAKAVISDFLRAHEEVVYKYRESGGTREWKNEDLEGIYEAINSGSDTADIYAMIREYESKYHESRESASEFNPYSEVGRSLFRK